MANREIQNLHTKKKSLWIKIKAQTFANQVLSIKHTFKF